MSLTAPETDVNTLRGLDFALPCDVWTNPKTKETIILAGSGSTTVSRYTAAGYLQCTTEATWALDWTPCACGARSCRPLMCNAHSLLMFRAGIICLRCRRSIDGLSAERL